MEGSLPDAAKRRGTTDPPSLYWVRVEQDLTDEPQRGPDGGDGLFLQYFPSFPRMRIKV